MYEIADTILYHIQSYLEFCFADRVYGSLIILFLNMITVLYIEIRGLIYKRKREVDI